MNFPSHELSHLRKEQERAEEKEEGKVLISA
jgi:hypothetical protein